MYQYGHFLSVLIPIVIFPSIGTLPRYTRATRPPSWLWPLLSYDKDLQCIRPNCSLLLRLQYLCPTRFKVHSNSSICVRQRELIADACPTNRIPYRPVLHGQRHRLSLTGRVWAFQEEKRVRVKGVKCPEDVRAPRHLLLAASDLREHEVDQETPELGGRLGAVAYARDEKVIELGVKCAGI